MVWDGFPEEPQDRLCELFLGCVEPVAGDVPVHYCPQALNRVEMREVFQSEPEARKAAEAKVKELRAGEGELSCDLVGSPKARAETPIKILGVAPDADGDWIASTVTHVWDYSDGGGATTTVEAEFGMEEKDDKKDANNKTSTSQSNSQPTGDYIPVLDR